MRCTAKHAKDSRIQVTAANAVTVPPSPTLIGALGAVPGPTPALASPEGQLDYAGLLAAARGVSRWLADSGIAAGARVALVQRDGPWAAVMLLGVSHAHAVLPLNASLSAEDYAFTTSDFGVVAVVAEEGVLDAARLAAFTVPVLSFRPWSVVAAGGEPPSPATPDRPAFLLHTSGTTARPKKVILTHGRIFQSARVIARALGLGRDDRCLTGMPMFHVHGILNALASTLVSGGSFVHAGPFDTLAFHDRLRAFRPTWITAVPTMYHAIAARSDLLPADRRLRFLRSSSAPMSDVLAERLESLFGVPLLSSYGMTEIDPIACVQVGETPPRGTVGRASGVDIRLVRAESTGSEDTDVADGDIGEVWVRGPRVIPAYEADIDINAAAFRDGWFRTGDLARRDTDGWLHLSGRIKEIINRAGEKVAPLEIDAVLLRHPDVVEAAAFGIADTVRGEDIAAAVVLRAGAVVTEHELRTWAAERLAFHKCPRRIQFVPALPKGPTGKLLRAALRLAPASIEPAPGDIGLVCAIWSEVLDLADVPPGARFLDLGGSSVAALAILARLSERIGARLPVDVLFDGDTPTALAAAINRHRETTNSEGGNSEGGT